MDTDLHRWGNSIRVAFAFALLFVLVGCTTTATGRKTEPKPVITVAYESSMMYTVSKENGKRILPGCDIFADGRCFLRSVDGDEITMRLPQGEVDDLLKFCEKQGFFSTSNKSLETSTKPQHYLLVTNDASGLPSIVTIEVPLVTVGNPAWVTDGTTTSIAIRCGASSNSISRYELDSEIAHYSSVPEFQIVGRCIERVKATVEKAIKTHFAQ